MSSTIRDTGLSSDGRHVEIQEGRDRSDAQLRRRFKESFTLSLTFSKAEKQGIAGGDRKGTWPVGHFGFWPNFPQMSMWKVLCFYSCVEMTLYYLFF